MIRFFSKGANYPGHDKSIFKQLPLEEYARCQTYCEIGNGGFEVQKTGNYEFQSCISRT